MSKTQEVTVSRLYVCSCVLGESCISLLMLVLIVKEGRLCNWVVVMWLNNWANVKGNSSNLRHGKKEGV
jgi:hypothetical protein